MHTQRIRSFVAVPLPGAVKAYLSKIQGFIRTVGGISASFPKTEGLHITIRFLGECSPQDFEIVKLAMDRAMIGHKPAMLRLGALGNFPKSAAKAKVLWIGLTGDLDRLQDIYRKLNSQLMHMEPYPSTAFSPHITLARIKNRLSQRTAERLMHIPYPLMENAPEFAAKEFALYKSELLPHGAQHTLMHLSTTAGSTPVPSSGAPYYP